MSSHVHLLLVAGADPLGSWTKSVHVRMARWLNTRHGRTGPVSADRPYAEAVVLPRSTTWHARNLTITPGDVLHAVADTTGIDARGRSLAIDAHSSSKRAGSPLHCGVALTSPAH